MHHHLSHKLIILDVSIECLTGRQSITSCLHNFFRYYLHLHYHHQRAELKPGHLEHKRSVSGQSRRHTQVHTSHVDSAKSRGSTTSSQLSLLFITTISLILHLLLVSTSFGQALVVVGQISSTAANAASAAATLLVARGLEPTPSVPGLQQYSLSFEPLSATSGASKQTVSESDTLGTAIKDDKIGISVGAERRNFGDRLGGLKLENGISRKSNVGATIHQHSNLTNVVVNSTVGKGKRDLINKLLKYRLPRSNALLGSWIRSSSNETVPLHPIRLEEVNEVELGNINLAANASTRDYQVVKVAGGPVSSSVKRYQPPKLSDRASNEDGGLYEGSKDKRWREKKGFWKAQVGGHEESSSQGKKKGSNGDDWLKERGHLRHGWKNVYHREELKDKLRYRDVGHNKDWPSVSNSSSKSGKFNTTRHDDNWEHDNENAGSKYDYVKGDSWKHHEEPHHEVEPGEDVAAHLYPRKPLNYSGSTEHKLGGSQGDISSASDQHEYISGEGGLGEPDEEAMNRIKRKLEKLESNMGINPFSRRARYNNTGTDSHMANVDVDYDDDWKHPENSLGPPKVISNTNHQHSINEILESTKAQPSGNSGSRNMSYNMIPAGSGQTETSTEEGSEEEGEDGGGEQHDGDGSGQDEQPGKKNEQIRLKLELDLGKSSPGKQVAAGKNLIIKNISMPTSSSVNNFSQPLGSVRPVSGRHEPTNFQKHPLGSNYLSSGGGGSGGAYRHPLPMMGSVSEWPVYGGSHSFQFTNMPRRSNGSMLAPRRPLATTPYRYVGSSSQSMRSRRLPPGFVEDEFAHLLPPRHPLNPLNYDNTEPFLGEPPSRINKHAHWHNIRHPMGRDFRDSNNNNDYRALDSGLSALSKILPSRPIFVKHLEMNGHLVADRSRALETSQLPYNNKSTSTKFITNIQHPLSKQATSLAPSEHNNLDSDEEEDEEPVFDGLNGSIGDTINIPRAHIESVEPPMRHQDYLMGSTNLRGRVKPETSSHYQELINSAGSVVADGVDPAFLYNGDFYPSQSAISTEERIPAANFLSPELSAGQLDLDSLVSEDNNHLLLSSAAGPAGPQDRYPVGPVTGDPLLALLEPASTGRHPLVAVATHALAHPLKSLNYATALLVNQQAGAHPLAASLVLPAVQHTFGRLFKLPRVLSPSLMSKHQLMTAASQLNMNLARHLTLPLGPTGDGGLMHSSSSPTELGVDPRDPSTSSPTSRWRHLIAPTALRALTLMAAPAAPLVEVQELLDASSTRLIPAAASINPASFVVPAIKVTARLQHLPSSSSSIKPGARGHLVAVLDGRPASSTSSLPSGRVVKFVAPKKEARGKGLKTPETRFKSWFSSSADSSSSSTLEASQTSNDKPPPHSSHHKTVLAGSNSAVASGRQKQRQTQKLESKKTTTSGLEAHKKPAASTSLLFTSSEKKKVTNQQQQQQQPGFAWFNIPYTPPANRHHWAATNKQALTKAEPHHETAAMSLINGANNSHKLPSSSTTTTTRRPQILKVTSKEPHFGQRIISSFKSKLNTVAG